MNHTNTVEAQSARSYRVQLLLGALIALVVSDGVITKFLVMQRYGQELNPLLLIWVGDGNFLIIKLLGAILAALLLWNISKQRPKLSLVVTSCFVAFYTAIVFWNLSILFLL